MSDNPLPEYSVIAFRPAFVKLTGSVNAALLLSQAVYWSNWSENEADRGGWFYKSQKEWESEIGLSRREQETARKRLWEASTRYGIPFWYEWEGKMPSRLYFRVDLEALHQNLNLYCQYGGNVHTSMSESAKQESTNSTYKKGANEHASMSESAKHIYTENTTEIKTQNTDREGAVAPSPPSAESAEEVQNLLNSFTITDEMRAWAKENTPEIDIDDYFATIYKPQIVASVREWDFWWSYDSFQEFQDQWESDFRSSLSEHQSAIDYAEYLANKSKK